MANTQYPLVSVTIPVYNTESFVARCLNSVLQQTYPNLEVIVVEDCSTDNSRQIVKDFLQNNANTASSKKFTLIENERNEGSALARSKGLQAAQGEWLLWLDSDDFWGNEQIISLWVERAMQSNSEVVVSDYYADYPRKIVTHRVPRIAQGKQFAYALLRGETQGFLHNKLIRKDLFLQRSMPWVAGENLLEDLGALIPFFYQTERVDYFDLPTVHYVQYNSGAYTKNVRSQSVQKMLSLVHRLEQVLAPECLKDSLLRESMPFVYWIIIRMLAEKAPLQDYPQIASIASQTRSSVWQLSLPFYDRLTLYLQTQNTLTFPLGRLMTCFKRRVKNFLRN